MSQEGYADTTQKTPQPVLPEPPGGSGATFAGALMHTHRQDKNLPDDSAQITWGLGGSCRVHKPGVPRGPTSTPGLGLGKQHVIHGPAQESKAQQAERTCPVADWKVYPKEQAPAR